MPGLKKYQWHIVQAYKQQLQTDNQTVPHKPAHSDYVAQDSKAPAVQPAGLLQKPVTPITSRVLWILSEPSIHNKHIPLIKLLSHKKEREKF